MAKIIRLLASSADIWETDWTKWCLCQEVPTDLLKSSDEGYTMLGKNIPLFHELNAIPIPLDIRRLNHGEGIESTMKKENAKYHNLCRIKFNNTKLERAQKSKMSPIPSGSSSDSDLANLYEERLAQLGSSSEQVHSTRLKDKLLQKMPKLEAHTKGRDVLSMFEKDIGPAIAFACGYNDTMHMAKTAEMIRCQLATTKTPFSGSLVSEVIDDSIPPPL
ncbi:Hypothetical predicted protein [Mytilus galloprovincialis]|uniref:Uncharacterized protein n=1 Tax=Mytilus galloprovincialis TaxID=29158 RepID=A0A8B6HES9_MYTGA|nr:Hypothetical predicted protein [Mytilus galloprovincialis]